MRERVILVFLLAFFIHIFNNFPQKFLETGNKIPAIVKRPCACENDPPKFWFSHKADNGHAFQSIRKIFLKLGWQSAAPNDATSRDTIHYDWDFLWTFEYFNYLPLNFSKLEFYQKINHIPGCYTLTSKSILSTKTNSKYIPQGFVNKSLLQEFAAENPGVRFVEKAKGNRGVRLKTVNQMDFKVGAGLTKEYFAQVFIEDPFLLDGHKFDFNIYVVITSVNPLRVYYYSKNIYVRVCRLPYNASDFSQLDSYVISDSFIPGFEFPAIKRYFQKGYTYKEAFDSYLLHRGHDPRKIYEQVEDCIQNVVSQKELGFYYQTVFLKAKYGTLHFVEMYRFDFLIDSKLNLHLMEVNLSPNLYASPKIYHNRHIMESAIYNYLNLVGVGTYLKKRHVGKLAEDEEDFLCHDNSISVVPDLCANEFCSESCENHPECQLCTFCMSDSQKYDFKLAYLEQMNSGDMKRVIPPPYVRIAKGARVGIHKEFLKTANDSYWNGLKPVNKLFTQWSLLMCKKNRHFC